MKLALFVSCIILPTFGWANKIDALETISDVRKFFIQDISKTWKKYSAFYDDTSKILSPKERVNFFKIDIDKNGLTDLLLNGPLTLMVLDNGNGIYSVQQLDKGTFASDKIYIESVDSGLDCPKIMISHKVMKNHEKTELLKYDTLVFRYGGLVEYNTDTVAEFNFQKLAFTMTGCWGKCPIYTLQINSDKSAIYAATKFNKKQGDFKEIVPEAVFDKLLAFLKYINPSKLDSSYKVDWTDDQTAITEITFNGKIKKTEDYGIVGRYGLMRLYEIMFYLRNKFDSDDE